MFGLSNDDNKGAAGQQDAGPQDAAGPPPMQAAPSTTPVPQDNLTPRVSQEVEDALALLENKNLASKDHSIQPDPAHATPTDPASQPAEPPEATQAAAALPPPTISSTQHDDLMRLKQQALSSLNPLVGHLEQQPEEKFKTTMMLIQASDNASLIPEAYAAANKITDEKARAQALLDVVNEINYFTHNGVVNDSEAPVTQP